MFLDLRYSLPKPLAKLFGLFLVFDDGLFVVLTVLVLALLGFVKLEGQLLEGLGLLTDEVLVVLEEGLAVLELLF